MAKVAASERDELYESRRTEIADAALRLWAEKGFDGTSVAAIAQAAGISKGTFYLYYPSKQDLLMDVLRRHSLMPNVQALAENIADAPFEEAVHTFVRYAWRHLSERRDLLLVALREMPSHLDQTREAIEKIFVPANKLIAAYLEEHLGADRAAEISTVIAGRGLIGTILFTFLSQEVLGAGRFLPQEEDDITATIAEVFLRGVLPRPVEEPAAR